MLAALPVALTQVPQMADLPNHVARHHILAQSLFDGGSPWWTVAWRWIGNLGVDLPAVLLTPWLGAELATRLVAMLIAPLTVLGLVALGRAAHGRVTPGVALSLPFAFAQPWHYGFLNSCLSVALALLVAAAWYRRPVEGWRRALGFGAAALAVWTAHIFGWGVLLILIGGAELAQGMTDWRRRLVRLLPLGLPLVPILAWRSASHGPAFTLADDLLRAKVLNFVTVLKGLSLPFDLAMTGAIGVLALVALAVAARPRVERRLFVAAILLILVTLALPTTVLGSWGADLRLAPVAVMIALAAIGPARDARHDRWLVTAGIALFIVRALAISLVWQQAQPRLAARLAIVDLVPSDGRAGFIAAPECRTPWALTIDRKLGSFAVPRRDAFANTLFLIPGADLINRRRPEDARWFDGSQDVRCGDPAALTARLAEMAAARFDLIWIAAPAAVPAPPGYRVVRRDATDTVFLRAPAQTGL